ncbi:Calmodulin-dependent protein kinase cmk2 [Dispira simplex]|nr:Calmodulin-dependent protein kinase cmk2 [Dispira simplex]
MGLLDHLSLGHQPPTYYKKKHYTFGKMLGSGTFGEVYEASRIKDKSPVAVKVIRKTLLNGDPTLVYKEIHVMQGIHHENIVELYDWFESRNNFYLVFSLATGGELFERISQLGRFSEQDAVVVMRTVFEAVAYLHGCNIVHRDLKPENLLYKDNSPDSPLVIADFGIAKTMRNDKDVLTTVCGSYGYVAPEIMRRQGYGKPVDLWSLGIIAFTVLCGYSPFYYCDDAQQMLAAMERHDVIFDKRYWWGVSEGAKDFIRALLHPDPAKRPTITEALAHPWLRGDTALDNDLLPDVIEQSKSRKTFQRAVKKVRMLNRLRKLSISSDESDETSGANTPNTRNDSGNLPLEAGGGMPSTATSAKSMDSFVSAVENISNPRP